MSAVDIDRERPVFGQRLREEWEDAIIKRYIYKEKGDVGAVMTPEEIKQALVGSPGAAGSITMSQIESYMPRYE